MPGWMGKVLRVNLGKRSFHAEPLGPGIRTPFIGGRGAGAKLLFDEVDPAVDPYAPENKLIFAAGPLTGSGAPAGCLFTVVTKSPLTGCIAASSSQGFFGAELKQAGFDILVIEGKADEPVYLDVSGGKPQLLPAGHLWGLTTSQTDDLIKERCHDKWKARDMSVACIGPAGERLSRIASIINDRHWAASRGGVGAVMGSKNLKAIALNGTQDLFLASGKPFMDVVLACVEQLKASPLTGKVLPQVGTAFLLDRLSESGALPARNFQSNGEVVTEVGGEALGRMLLRQTACFSCPIGCDHVLPAGRGVRAATAPGFEAIAALGPGCGVADIPAIVRAYGICIEMGLDAVSAGGAIAAAMELSEKGVLGQAGSGASVRFGDADALLKLLQDTGLRRGFGDVLAEGGYRLCERYGHPEAFMGVRQQEMPGCDGRVMQGVGLHFATSNSGPAFDSGDILLPEVLGLNGPVDPAFVEGKADLVIGSQDLAALVESCGLCCRILMGGLSVAEIFAMMEMVTASGLNDADLLKAGERVFNLERLFNQRAGSGGGKDMLPRRMLEEPLGSGPSAGRVSRLAEMLPEYYRLRGWDAEGRPRGDLLSSLGLAGGRGVEGGR